MERVEASKAPPGRPDVDLVKLIRQFYPLVEANASSITEQHLGTFSPVSSAPAPYDRLLDHNAHMTVTVEKYLGQLVDVVVHRTDRAGNWYAREITLQGTQTPKVIQYGIVTLDVSALAPEVWQRIEGQGIPLGRVLIEHNVLREVQLCGLWQIKTGPALADFLNVASGQTVYGRTALIYCDGVPTIELLEIVVE